MQHSRVLALVVFFGFIFLSILCLGLQDSVGSETTYLPFAEKDICTGAPYIIIPAGNYMLGIEGVEQEIAFPNDALIRICDAWDVNTAGHGTTLGTSAYTQVRIYDIRGRLKRTLVDETQEVRIHYQYWDGKDDIGQYLPSGIYFAKVDANDCWDIISFAYINDSPCDDDWTVTYDNDPLDCELISVVKN